MIVIIICTSCAERARDVVDGETRDIHFRSIFDSITHTYTHT